MNVRTAAMEAYKKTCITFCCDQVIMGICLYRQNMPAVPSEDIHRSAPSGKRTGTSGPELDHGHCSFYEGKRLF